MLRRAAVLGFVVLALPACEPKSPIRPQEEACSRQEWTRRTPMSGRCRAAMQAAADKAEADRQRLSVLSPPPPRRPRHSF